MNQPIKCDKCGTLNGPIFLITQFITRITMLMAPIAYLVFTAERTSWATILGSISLGLFGLGMTIHVLRGVARGNK
jgi:hypothetical protein